MQGQNGMKQVYRSSFPVFQCFFLFVGSPLSCLLAKCPWNLLQHFSITWHHWWIFGRYLSGKTVQSKGLFIGIPTKDLYIVSWLWLLLGGGWTRSACFGIGGLINRTWLLSFGVNISPHPKARVDCLDGGPNPWWTPPGIHKHNQRVQRGFQPFH